MDILARTHSQNALFLWLLTKVRIDQRLGYEPTEIGYKSSECETSVGTKRLDTVKANHLKEMVISIYKTMRLSLIGGRKQEQLQME